MGEILSLLKSAAQNFPVTSEPRGRPPKDAPGAGQLCCTGQLQNLPSPALPQTLLDVQPISHTKAQTDLLHIYGTPQSPHPQSFFRHSLSPGASRSSARHLQPRCLPSTTPLPTTLTRSLWQCRGWGGRAKWHHCPCTQGLAPSPALHAAHCRTPAVTQLRASVSPALLSEPLIETRTRQPGIGKKLQLAPLSLRTMGCLHLPSASTSNKNTVHFIYPLFPLKDYHNPKMPPPLAP